MIDKRLKYFRDLTIGDRFVLAGTSQPVLIKDGDQSAHTDHDTHWDVWPIEAVLPQLQDSET